jgi:hypothetical protein
MPDDLYHRDILAWSQAQADRLRRMAAGERVNDLDWPNVIEEVETVGRNELRACESLLLRGIAQLLKIRGWPDCQSIPHWRSEARGFLRSSWRAFSPSMAQHLDIAALYSDACETVGEDEIDGKPPLPLPAVCPFHIRDVLADKVDVNALIAALQSAA